MNTFGMILAVTFGFFLSVMTLTPKAKATYSAPNGKKAVTWKFSD